MTFGEHTISVLERQLRLLRYWGNLWDQAQALPDEQVTENYGWTKLRIEKEYHFALIDLLN